MENPTSKALSAAVLRLLRPLVRLLLRNGVSYGVFADLAKWVFVDVARQEFGVAGRKQSDARVSVVTGLSRKEVARVKHIAAPDDAAASKQYNRAARVIAGWSRDRRFADGRGRPAALPFDGGARSFAELVRLYSGDMTPRAVLDELQRVQAVQTARDGRLRLVTDAYIPRGSSADKLHILGSDVAFLIETIDHNLQESGARPRFQRKVAYDNLPQEVLPEFRELAGKKAQDLLIELDAYLSRHDRDSNPAAQGTGRKQAGVGIYYFEQDITDNNKESAQ